MTDLTFVDDGNKDLIEGTNLINVTKLRYTAGIMFNLREGQSKDYHLQNVPEVQAYLLSAPVLSDSELKQQSLLREPRKQN